MQKYECPCGYVYDPEIGDPDNGIAPGTAWEDVPEDWLCPTCGLGKDVLKNGLLRLFLSVLNVRRLVMASYFRPIQKPLYTVLSYPLLFRLQNCFLKIRLDIRI